MVWEALRDSTPDTHIDILSWELLHISDKKTATPTEQWRNPARRYIERETTKVLRIKCKSKVISNQKSDKCQFKQQGATASCLLNW